MTHRSPAMVMEVVQMVHHLAGVTLLMMGGCSSSADAYGRVTAPAAVATRTSPWDRVVMHRSCMWGWG